MERTLACERSQYHSPAHCDSVAFGPVVPPGYAATVRQTVPGVGTINRSARTEPVPAVEECDGAD